MAINPIRGLFGDTFGETSALLQKERDARVRQAMAENIQGGGNYYSALIAKANQQMAEGISEAVGGIGSQMPIMQKMGMREDPRLAKARKRSQDRNDLMEMFKDAEADDDITVAEKEAIIDEMMKRGYIDEATKFSKIWQGRYANKTARAKALKAGSPDVGDIWIDQNGNQVKGNIVEIGGINYMVADDGTRTQIPSTYRKISKGMLTRSMLDEDKFFDLKQELRLNINTANRLIKYAQDVGKGGKGFQFLANKIIGNVKSYFGANLSEAEIRAKIQTGKLNQLIGQFRLETVGGGVMTEKDAERVVQVLGGNPSALRSPQVLGELLEDMLKEKIGLIEDKIGQYNAQRKVGPFRGEANYPLMKMPKFNMNIFSQLKQGNKPKPKPKTAQSSGGGGATVQTPSGGTATITVIK
tara:strand:- start:2410 stop:3648 length:1239 start_codon:yes stop_codon:yes gene_type:complete